MQIFFIDYLFCLIDKPVEYQCFTALSGRVVLRLILSAIHQNKAINTIIHLTNAQYKICNNPN